MRIQLDHPYTGGEMAHILSIPPPRGHRTAMHLATDSREVEAGDLFVALRGERQDGHAFLAEARARGAALLLCEEGADDFDGRLCVPSTEGALSALAAAARARISPRVVAVTGSAGKTTVKNMLAAVLSGRYRVHKTAGNYNNLLGLSLTLLSMPQDSEYAVLEMGMNHAREIAALSHLARPDCAVITNVGTAHIGNLGSRENIARAKLEILEGCAPLGEYFYPEEERLLLPPCHCGLLCIPVGRTQGAPYGYENCRTGERITLCDFTVGRRVMHGVEIGGLGRHMCDCARFAVAVGDRCGASEEEIRAGLRENASEGLRQCIRYLGNIEIIEDCYNASCESMAAALSLLAERARGRGGRAIALLGDIREAGVHSARLHREVGALAYRAGVSLLFTLGPEADEIAAGARAEGMDSRLIHRNEDWEAIAQTVKALEGALREGDTLLVKASRAVGAERVSRALFARATEKEEGK